MKLRRVDPKEIKIPEVRVTARFDDDLFDMFKSSIREVGQVAPIICCEVDGSLVLVDGQHRLIEAVNNKVPKIDVAVVPGDMIDVLTKNIFLDHLRGKTPISEMITVIETLWQEYSLNSEQIAEKTGLTRDYVEKLQLISTLTPACRAALDEGRIGVGHAAALTKIKDPSRQEVILGQLELYHWTVKETEDFVREVNTLLSQKVEPGPAPEPVAPAALKCHFCQGEYDLAQLSNPNICVHCAGELLLIMAQAKRDLEREKKEAEAKSQVVKDETNTPEGETEPDQKE